MENDSSQSKATPLHLKPILNLQIVTLVLRYRANIFIRVSAQVTVGGLSAVMRVTVGCVSHNNDDDDDEGATDYLSLGRWA